MDESQAPETSVAPGIVESPAVEAPESTQEISSEDAAQQHLSKVYSKFGGAPQAATGELPTPAVTKDTPVPPPAPRKSAKEIDPQFYERVSRRARLAQMEAENAQLRQILAAQQAPPAPPEAQQDLEPDFNADPKGWYLWRDRETAREFEKRLDPLRQFVEMQARAFEANQQQTWQSQQAAARNAEARSLMAESEQAYLQTPEGAGFNDRLGGYVNALTRKHTALGQEQPREAANAELRQMVVQAMNSGVNPAAYIDLAFQEMLGGQAQAPAATTQTQMDPRLEREAAQLRAASQSGVAGTVGRASSPRNSQQTAIQNGAKARTANQLREELMTGKQGTWKDRILATRRAAIESGS